MAQLLKCPNCGSIDFTESGQLHICKRCGSANNFARHSDDVMLSLSAAFMDRQKARFADARSIYDDILRRAPDCHEAYFGLFLCDYSVLFESDGAGEKFPSFYGVKKTPVWESENLKKALKLAGNERGMFDGYKAQAEKVEYARTKYLHIAAVTPPWDVFICFKRTARDGRDTKDYVLAQQLYAKLCQKYRVFYSDASLDGLEHREFEPNIYYALYTSKALILICSEREYVESTWVKNEWSRFLALNSAGAVLPVFTADCNIQELPAEIRKLQGYGVRELDFYAKLDRAADALVFSERRKSEREEREAAERAAREREWRERERALFERVSGAAAGSFNIAGMVSRARMELRDGNFSKCTLTADKILDLDPECAEAWWLLFLSQNGLSSENELYRLDNTAWPEAREAKRALEFADNSQRAVYESHVKAWIGRCLNEAAEYRAVKSYDRARAAISRPLNCAEACGGSFRFDVYFLALLLELNGSDEETVCLDDVTRWDNYIRAERYADQMQKETLVRAAESARAAADKYRKMIADKNAEVIKAAAECEAVITEAKTKLSDTRTQNSERLREQDERRKNLRETHACELKDCDELVLKLTAEKDDYGAARGDAKKKARLTIASAALGVIIYFTLALTIALVSGYPRPDAMMVYIALITVSALGLGWLCGGVWRGRKKGAHKGAFMSILYGLAAIFYFIYKFVLLPPFQIIYTKKRFDKETEAQIKKYEDAIRGARDGLENEKNRQHELSLAVNERIDTLYTSNCELEKKAAELDAILGNLRQSAQVTGLANGVNTVSEITQFLTQCDEAVTGIRNVKEYAGRI